MRLILLLLLFVVTCASAQKPIPMTFEDMQLILGDRKIVYIKGWVLRDKKVVYKPSWKREDGLGVVNTVLLGDALQVKGQFGDGVKFTAWFGGEMIGQRWIPNGKAELCVGEEYCELDWEGCEGKCRYKYIEKVINRT